MKNNKSYGIVEFFNKFNEPYYINCFNKLTNKLLEKISFEIKILNTSIQFTDENTTFSACGFRRNKDYFFVEFYNKDKITDKRIVREAKHNNVYQGKKIGYIISRVEIRNEIEIDEELIGWIVESYKLVENIDNASA